MPTVQQISFYPVKSCRGLSLDRAEIGPRGILHDREWMVVDESGRFITQRECPRLALVSPLLADDRLTLSAPALDSIELPLDQSGLFKEVVVWKSTCLAVDQGDAVAAWFEEFLHVHCRLVRMHPEHVRRVNPQYARRPGDQVGFADGYPFLLIGDGSLADLNSRLRLPLPMNRFRPNLVVGPTLPFEEDEWTDFRIGEVGFSRVKACSRCATTQTDQLTGKRGKEPLATLASYRKVGNDVFFGQNLIHEGPGTIRVGDEVIHVNH